MITTIIGLRTENKAEKKKKTRYNRYTSYVSIIYNVYARSVSPLGLCARGVFTPLASNMYAHHFTKRDTYTRTYNIYL